MSQININLVLCEKCDDDFRNFYNIFDRIKEDDNHTASFVIVTLGNILDTENRKYFLEYRVKNCNKNSDKYGLAAKIGSAKMIAQEKTDTDVEFKNYNNVRGKIVVNNLEFLSKGKHTIEVYLGQDDKEKELISTYTFLVE